MDSRLLKNIFKYEKPAFVKESLKPHFSADFGLMNEIRTFDFEYFYLPNSGVARLFFFTKKFVNLHEMWTYTFINSNKNLTLHVFSTLHVYKK